MVMSKWVKTGMLVFCFVCMGASCAQSLSRAIQTIVQKDLPDANVGMLFVDSKTGQALYEHNQNHLYCPASVTKLFTAAAVLYKLGAEYQYTTQLLKKGDNVYIKFVGDPSLKREDLERLVASLKQQHGTTIEGDFIIDSTRYSAPDYPADLTYEDLGWYYAAPINAIILDENAVTYEFDTNHPFNSQPKITVKDVRDASTLTIHNRARIKSAEQVKHHCSLHISSTMDNALTLYGCLQQRKAPYTQMFAVPNPRRLAEQVIQQTLGREGITLQGRVRDGVVPKDATELATHQSKPMADLITHMLKDSDNVYANSLAKTLGYAVTGKGSFTEAAFAIKHILEERTSVDYKHMSLSDGAGNRFNLISPTHVVGLLQQLYTEPKLFEVLSKALPQSGVSGSLADRMRDDLLKGKVLAKTGSMHDIAALAGYLYRDEGEPVIFCMISNQVGSSIWAAKGAEEQVLKTFMIPSWS